MTNRSQRNTLSWQLSRTTSSIMHSSLRARVTLTNNYSLPSGRNLRWSSIFTNYKVQLPAGSHSKMRRYFKRINRYSRIDPPSATVTHGCVVMMPTPGVVSSSIIKLSPKGSLCVVLWCLNITFFHFWAATVGPTEVQVTRRESTIKHQLFSLSRARV